MINKLTKVIQRIYKDQVKYTCSKDVTLASVHTDVDKKISYVTDGTYLIKWDQSTLTDRQLEYNSDTKLLCNTQNLIEGFEDYQKPIVFPDLDKLNNLRVNAEAEKAIPFNTMVSIREFFALIKAYPLNTQLHGLHSLVKLTLSEGKYTLSNYNPNMLGSYGISFTGILKDFDRYFDRYIEGVEKFEYAFDLEKLRMLNDLSEVYEMFIPFDNVKPMVLNQYNKIESILMPVKIEGESHE